MTEQQTDNPGAGQHVPPNESGASGPDRTTRDPPSLFKPLITQDLKSGADYCGSKPAGDADRWLHSYICELHITDVVQIDVPLAVAGFTFVLMLVGLGQWFAMRRQAEIAANQLKLTVSLSSIERRPRLTIRDVAPTPDAIGGPVYIDFTLTNSGHGSCVIRSAEFHFFTEMQGSRPIEHRAMISDLTKREIPEASVERVVVQAENVTWEGIDGNTGGDFGGGFFFVGRMSYADENGIHRWVGFRRKYNPGRGRFYPEPGGDDEYQD